MSKCPHIHRRGNTLYFRIAVPVRLRPVLRVRELTQSLYTQSRPDAIPAAYKLAGEAKTLFRCLAIAMSDKESKSGSGAIDDFDDLDDEFLRGVVDAIEKKEKEAVRKKGSGQSLKIMMALKKKDIEIGLIKERHEEELSQAKKDAELKVLRTLGGQFAAALQNNQPIAAPVAQQASVKAAKPVKKKGRASKKLSATREEFLLSIDKSRPNAKKTVADKWWKLFVEMVGDKSINELEQVDVDSFLEDVSCYPANDSVPKYEKLNTRAKIALCKRDGDLMLSEKTILNNYKAPVKKFLEYLWAEYRRDGVSKLNTDDVKYRGNQQSGENEQRDLTIDEVKRLFDNDKMRQFVSNPLEVHQYWLLVVALFSGMRLNECCQLHPVNDIRQDDNELWFFEVTEENEFEKEVTKSAKTNAGRRIVPVHQKLIDLGFIEYVTRRRGECATIIFPFEINKDKVTGALKAGVYAGRFVVKYFTDIGLRDKTPGENVTGLHSLRKTAYTMAATCGMVDFLHIDDEEERFNQSLGRLAPIMGHETKVRNKSGITAAMPAHYAKRKIKKLKEIKKGDISREKAVIDRMDYGLTFPEPK